MVGSYLNVSVYPIWAPRLLATTAPSIRKQILASHHHGHPVHHQDHFVHNHPGHHHGHPGHHPGHHHPDQHHDHPATTYRYVGRSRLDWNNEINVVLSRDNLGYLVRQSIGKRLPKWQLCLLVEEREWEWKRVEMRSLNWCLIDQSEMDKEVVVVVVTLKTSFIFGNQWKYLFVLMIMDEVYT